MDAILKTILEAPLPNLLIFAGLIFVGLSVLGGISGKLEPGKQGRIAAGVIGALLMLVGIYLSVSGAGIPQAARTPATSPLEAPLPNVLIVAGLLFVGVGVLGGISGKFEPDRQGRIAAGGVGGLLLLIGFVMVFSGASAAQSARALTPPAAAPSSVAVLQPTALPAVLSSPIPAPSATALPAPVTLPSTVATAPSSPIAPPGTVVSPSPVIFVPRREMSVTIAASGDMTFDESWTLQFGPRATRQFGLSYNSGGGNSDRKLDSWAMSEGDVPYVENSSRQADHTFEVLPTTAADGTKRYAITWYFPTTVNQTRTFGIHYVWHAAITLTPDGVAVMRWRAHATRPWAVGSERIAIRLPRSYDPALLFALSQWNGVDGAGARIVDGQNVEFTGQNITPDLTWDVQLRYPAP